MIFSRHLYIDILSNTLHHKLQCAFVINAFNLSISHGKWQYYHNLTIKLSIFIHNPQFSIIPIFHFNVKKNYFLISGNFTIIEKIVLNSKLNFFFTGEFQLPNLITD